MIEEKKTVQDRGIAIALSALMVLSVVAVGAAAITPAAAQTVDQADRSVDSTEVQPGDTVQVTVDVTFDQGQSFQIDEGFSPAFSNAEIVDADGASFDAAEDDRVVARYGVLGDPPRGSATLVYEVTVPDSANEGDTFEISSNADSDVDLGTTVLTVTQGDGDGSRTVPSTAQAGDTVQVTVDVAFDQGQSFQIDEGFSPAFSNAEIVDADGASFDAAEDDRVVARYGVLGDPPRGSATLVYEVTVPDSANEGDTFEISSNADSDVDLGTTVLTVTQGDGDGSRTVPSTAQAGDTVQVTVDVAFDQGQSFQIDEGFSPAFSNAEIVDSDGASSEAAEDDRVVARYGVLDDPPRGSATLVYEVEIPDDADTGDTFEISSNADSDIQLGIDVIEVSDVAPPDVNDNGQPAQDLDGDGLYEDVTGDGQLQINDVQALFFNRDSDAVQNNAQLFNFDGQEPASIDVSDVQALFVLFQES
jgi:surface glycoprotein (TIGR04207 family)